MLMSDKLPLQRPKLGFLLRDTSPSELSYNILTRGTKHSDDIDTVIFFEHITRPCIDSLVAKMHISEAYSFDGPIISTDLNTTIKLINFPTPCPKLFFLNDLEWTRLPQKNFAQLSLIYRYPELTYICRSEDHKTLVQNCWNSKVSFVINRYNFYTPELLSFLTKNSKPLYGEKQTRTINVKSLNI